MPISVHSFNWKFKARHRSRESALTINWFSTLCMILALLLAYSLLLDGNAYGEIYKHPEKIWLIFLLLKLPLASIKPVASFESRERQNGCIQKLFLFCLLSNGNEWSKVSVSQIIVIYSFPTTIISSFINIFRSVTESPFGTINTTLRKP